MYDFFKKNNSAESSVYFSQRDCFDATYVSVRNSVTEIRLKCRPHCTLVSKSSRRPAVWTSFNIIPVYAAAADRSWWELCGVIQCTNYHHDDGDNTTKSPRQELACRGSLMCRWPGSIESFPNAEIVLLQGVSIACYAERCISYSKSVQLSVRPSVTRWHWVKTIHATIMVPKSSTLDALTPKGT